VNTDGAGRPINPALASGHALRLPFAADLNVGLSETTSDDAHPAPAETKPLVSRCRLKGNAPDPSGAFFHSILPVGLAASFSSR